MLLKLYFLLQALNQFMLFPSQQVISFEYPPKSIYLGEVWFCNIALNIAYFIYNLQASPQKTTSAQKTQNSGAGLGH